MNALTKVDLRNLKPSRTEFMEVTRHPIYLVLDNLKAAHNIGTILRLADALLVRKVYICGPQTIVPPNRKIRDGSRGAERWVPWEYRGSAGDIVRELKEAGVRVVSVELCDRSVKYSEASYSFPMALVFGREYDGVSPDVLSLVDAAVSLPMFGMANSINVANAASVVLYDAVRQLHSANEQGNS